LFIHSVIRDVPSHQEVFADEGSDSSIIIELLDLPEGVSNEESAVFHFKVLAEDNDAVNPQVFQVNPAPPEFVPHFGPEVFKLVLFGQQSVRKFREDALNVVNIYLACLRLANAKTDVLITMNTPVIINPASSSSVTPELNPALSQEIFVHVLKTFKLKDWSLFG